MADDAFVGLDGHENDRRGDRFLEQRDRYRHPMQCRPDVRNLQ
jgi:hypothetical protein